MSDIIILDNVIPKEKQRAVEQLVTNPSFQWSFGYSSVTQDYVEKYPARMTADSLHVPQMISMLYKDKQEASPIFLEFIPIISAIPFTIGQLLKVKLNLTLPAAGATLTSYGIPHCDVPNMPNNMTAIYYINDSDGDTVIFNESYGYEGPLTEKMRVSPKQGRLVILPGSLLHAGNYPTTNNPRLIANINFIPFLN